MRAEEALRILDLSTFTDSLNKEGPPESLGTASQALWWLRKGDREMAHRLVMGHAGKDCAWVHALLHRAEGDLDNARYRYSRAGRPQTTGDLNAECDAILTVLLEVERDLP